MGTADNRDFQERRIKGLVLQNGLKIINDSMSFLSSKFIF